jgi:hypothetical protein
LRFHTNTNFVEKEIITFLDNRIIEIEDFWFIPRFVTFQYGDNFQYSKQKSVQSAITLLRKYNLIKENPKGILTLSIPLDNPKPRVMDMDMDMDTNMVMDVVTDMVMDVKVEMEVDDEFDINKLNEKELIDYLKKNK